MGGNGEHVEITSQAGDKEEDPELFEPESSSDAVPPCLSTTLGNQDGDETRASFHE